MEQLDGDIRNAKKLDNNHAFDNISLNETKAIARGLNYVRGALDSHSHNIQNPGQFEAYMRNSYTVARAFNRCYKAVGSAEIPEVFLKSSFGEHYEEPSKESLPVFWLSDSFLLRMVHNAVLSEFEHWKNHLANCPFGHETLMFGMLIIVEKVREICTNNCIRCTKLEKETHYFTQEIHAQHHLQGDCQVVLKENYHVDF